MNSFTMSLPSLLTLLLLAAFTSSQASDSEHKEGGSFQWVQPRDTKILGPYGHSPPVYPSPNATGTGGWEAALAKAQDFAAQLTIEEKADMVTGTPGPCVGNIAGISRLNFSGLCLQDGPLAIRLADYASVFQAGISAASTWDKDILYERGLAMGQEFRAKGAHIALSPVCGPLGRSAYAGRNWEGFSPDPYLSGVAMEKTVAGHQDAGVQATPKHFIGNEQETMRNPEYNLSGGPSAVSTAAISSNIDDRTMHELYLWPFANAIRARAASVMCAYQRINGSYACHNSKALNGLLKGELGFQGFVMSDWGSTHSGVASMEAGLDMNMPGGLGMYGSQTNGSLFGDNVVKAVNNGSLPMSRVDDMIVRIMTPYYALGQDQGFPSVDPSSADLNTFSEQSTWLHDFNLTSTRSRDVRGDHGSLIRRHGAAATVLLKNENKTLPLKAPKSIAVFGNSAGDITEGFYNQMDYEYGALVAGGGSGTGRLSYLVSPLAAINTRAKQDNTLVQQWLRNKLIASSDVRQLWIPEPPEVCLVFLKTWAEEAKDRTSLHVDWDGDKMVDSVAKHCSNTVVITHSSGINVLPWASHPNVTAIVAAHFPGQESGNSLVDILYGDVNPSGKLPYTIAHKASDYNAPPTTDVNTTGEYDWQSWFDEKLEIDYRYFDAHNISVLYEFGHGLSYTTFELGVLKGEGVVDSIISAPQTMPTQPGGNPALWQTIYTFSVPVTNSGNVAGATVAQLYVTFPESTPEGTPPRQLRGFDKIFLAAGETGTARFELMRRDLSYWDIHAQEWLIPEGEFTISVGFSSRELRQFAKVTPVG